MQDFARAVKQLNSLTRYYKLEEGGINPTFIDQSAYAVNGSGTAFKNAAGGFTLSAAPGFLLDQHQPTLGVCFAALSALGGGVNPNVNVPFASGTGGLLGQSDFTLIFGGLKPHDMTANRVWATQPVGNAATPEATAGGILLVVVNSDGSVSFGTGGSSMLTTPAGLIKQYQAHLLAVSWQSVTKTATIRVGDWTGRIATPATSTGTVQQLNAGATNIRLGQQQPSSAYSAADGFLDDFAACVGHAISDAEFSTLMTRAGYTAALSYTPAKGHRNNIWNRGAASQNTLAANSAAAASNLSSDALTSQGTNSSSINYYQFDETLYTVTKAQRTDPAQARGINGPLHYANPLLTMLFQDVPIPYQGQSGTGAFQPAGGSDGHCTIWCPETDEVWDMGVLSFQTSQWQCNYGGYINYTSLDQGFFPNNYEGARATGLPTFYGAALINEFLSNSPIPHALSLVVAKAKAGNVWPAQRGDGTTSTYTLQEGMWIRLKQDSATTSLIQAMPNPAGRKLAVAAQQYGMIVVDTSAYNVAFEAEDLQQFQTVNGYSPYYQDVNGVHANGIWAGDQYTGIGSGQVLQSFPWNNIEVLDSATANPAAATQAVLPAPVITGSSRANDRIAVRWNDLKMAQYYNIYVKTGASYTLAGQSQWPSFTLWSPAVTEKTFAVTAVNGGGESPKSADFTPPLPLRSRRRPRTLMG